MHEPMQRSVHVWGMTYQSELEWLLEYFCAAATPGHARLLMHHSEVQLLVSSDICQ